jgi:hypothetical protein
VEETDPAQILPGKKHVVETSAPGSVGPMVPPMGMPMSPHLPTVPAEPVPSREVVTGELPPAEPFGSPAVYLANHAPQEFSALEPGVIGTTSGAVYGEPVVAHTALEPRILPVALEPQTLPAPLEPHILPAPWEPRTLPVAVERGRPADACCSCCGESHDGQEDRPIDRDQERGERGKHEEHDERDERDEFGHDHADHHRGEHAGDRHEPGRGESEGTHTSTESEHSCSCCGEDHAGPKTTDPKDPPPGGLTDTEGDTEGETEEPESDSEDCLPPTEPDTCGPDSKPDAPQETSPTKPLAPSESTKPGTPLTPSESTKPGTPLTPSESTKPAIPLAPTESTGYAVAEKDKAAEPSLPGGPRAPMAPPVSEKLSPMQPVVPRATTGGQQPATPVEPKTFSKSSGPPGSSGTPLVPLQQGQTIQAPFAPVTTPQPAPAPAPQSGGGAPPTEGQPTTLQPTTLSVPGPVTNTGVPPVTTGGTGNPFVLPGTGSYGGGTVPTDGNVGPDPNIKFDEAQYNQLIGVIAGVQGTLDDATSIDVTYLDAELRLQPNGQTWEYATNLVTRGGRFGASVDTESTNLEKSLKSFHAALEQAKEVFKETDDLAAYDATRFSTDYPGFGSSGPGLV